jgi:hypothetical protein
MMEDKDLTNALSKFPDYVKGKNGLVVGSEKPWCEVMALNAGAAHVTTSEYSRIVTNHTQLSAFKPSELAAKVLAPGMDFEPFDFAISFSSMEHAGLGRYGDAHNPYGDFEAAAQVSFRANRNSVHTHLIFAPPVILCIGMVYAQAWWCVLPGGPYVSCFEGHNPV